MNMIFDEKEMARQRDLNDYAILDTPPEESFDRITRLAKMTLQTPMSVVSLVADNRQWFKSRIGVTGCETARDISFCTHTIQQAEPMVIRDAYEDPRFTNSPLVRGDPFIRFYIGAPLLTPAGYNIGALCAMDTVPHDPSADQVKLLQDLARLVVDELELRKIACLDPLTGAFTKRGLDQALHRLTENGGVQASVIVMDIDHFKNVNDTYGHNAGDRVIQHAIRACRSVLRPQDIVARIGGEEFAVILPGLPMTEGFKAAERMRAAVAAENVAAREGIIAVTASFGVAPAGRNFEAAIAAADAAMYQAKVSGRNAVCGSTPTLAKIA